MILLFRGEEEGGWEGGEEEGEEEDLMGRKLEGRGGRERGWR